MGKSVRVCESLRNCARLCTYWKSHLSNLLIRIVHPDLGKCCSILGHGHGILFVKTVTCSPRPSVSVIPWAAGWQGGRCGYFCLLFPTYLPSVLVTSVILSTQLQGPHLPGSPSRILQESLWFRPAVLSPNPSG